METLKMIVHKQTISANNYVVPSGNREVYTLQVEFQNSDWDEFTKFAVFYRDDTPDAVYDVIMKNDIAEIPQEVLAKQGIVRAGILGRLDGKQLMATDLMKINVIKGAPTAVIEPSETVFEQILDDYAIVNTQLKDAQNRLDLLINGKTTDLEIIDIRKKIDGEVSDTAGNAVREQVILLRDNLIADIEDVAVDDYSRIVYQIGEKEEEILTKDDVMDIAEAFKNVIRYEVTFASLTDAQKQELINNVILPPEATNNTSGLMSSSDKAKLDYVCDYVDSLDENLFLTDKYVQNLNNTITQKLNNYYTKNEVNQKMNNLDNYYTKDEIQNNFVNKDSMLTSKDINNLFSSSNSNSSDRKYIDFESLKKYTAYLKDEINKMISSTIDSDEVKSKLLNYIKENM